MKIAMKKKRNIWAVIILSRLTMKVSNHHFFFKVDYEARKWKDDHEEDLLVSFGIFWYLLLSFRIFWYLLLSFVIFWYLLLSFGIYWYQIIIFFSKLIMKLANEKQNGMMFMKRIFILANYSGSRLMWSLIMILIILCDRLCKSPSTTFKGW